MRTFMNFNNYLSIKYMKAKHTYLHQRTYTYSNMSDSRVVLYKYIQLVSIKNSCSYCTQVMMEILQSSYIKCLSDISFWWPILVFYDNNTNGRKQQNIYHFKQRLLIVSDVTEPFLSAIQKTCSQFVCLQIYFPEA